jgi:hypothetical protein
MATDQMNLFEPDSVLPDQFFSAFSRQYGLGSERQLMLAVLQDAVDCYQKYALARDPRGKFEFDEASRWIESVDREWPYSFENICDVLGIDPVCVREGLAKFGRGRRQTRRRAAHIEPLLTRERYVEPATEPEGLKQAS